MTIDRGGQVGCAGIIGGWFLWSSILRCGVFIYCRTGEGEGRGGLHYVLRYGCPLVPPLRKMLMAAFCSRCAAKICVEGIRRWLLCCQLGSNIFS